ncbi:MAG TPA: PleD family two-component system response regulator [Alphaproteobacteria bacterium]|nr:PleD family two-component system response regulator [Rhodospirillaceae bacterium]HRJ65972.1 PleD family two-component system response regulator [Alphaproteobacteria bacterium]
MTARVLVVDDILPNVKLLEAKLSGEYFDVITASSGAEAIQKAEKESPDIILLDVMMPGMDGFETCQRLKSSPATAHIPVVMVTALTDATDRVRGLESGADDFLSKPVNDIALMARVRSLVRLKMTVDEWRIRENTANQFGFVGNKGTFLAEPSEKARVLIIEDKSFESEKFIETLKRDDDEIVAVRSGDQAMDMAQHNDFDIITVSLNLQGEDGLRLCSHLRSNERTRAVPILMVAEEGDMKRIAQGLEIGAHDYILRPVDRNELLARVRTQIRRKRYQDRLRSNYEQSLSLALTDSLTGLFNRRYLMVHLEKLLNKNKESNKSLCCLMMDIDHFKKINDTYGHQVGDDVLKVFAERVSQRLRSFDLVARLGGEEFVVVLPDISQDMAFQVAERLRKGICNTKFEVSGPHGQIDVSVSIGAAMITGAQNLKVEDVLKQADDELYRAKEGGRNRVYFMGHGHVQLPERPPAPPPADGSAPAEEKVSGDTIKKII